LIDSITFMRVRDM